MLRSQGNLDGERLLGRKTVELMTQNHLPPHIHTWDDPAWGFGLGVGVLLDPARAKILGSAGTYGWSGAASTDYWYDPQEDLIGILMTQFMPNGNRPIAQEFKVLAQQALVD
jgi:CubicO group peptidase (beta-lactamase class C family)